MPRSPHPVPQYRLYVSSGQARARWRDREFYLGRYDSPQSKQLYSQLLTWIQSGDVPRDWKQRSPHAEATTTESPSTVDGITIVELMAKFLTHCGSYYVRSNETDHIRYALRPVRKLFGHTTAADFGPLRLKQVRQAMVDDGLSRSGINKRIDRIRRMFRWGVEQELLDPAVFDRLRSVQGLKFGRTEARETEAIGPVAVDQIEAIRPFVLPQVWAMVQLQLLTAMRPGEVVQMRRSDLDTTGDVWLYCPKSIRTNIAGCSAPFVSDRSRVLLNNGNGVFMDDGQSLGIEKTASVVLSDLDGDGDLDLVEGIYDQANRVWWNDGTGEFTDSG